MAYTDLSTFEKLTNLSFAIKRLVFVTSLKFSVVSAAELIEINPKIMMGKPVIKGTRITVEQVLETLSESTSIENALRAHPNLTTDQIHAVLAFAAKWMRGDEIYALAK